MTTMVIAAMKTTTTVLVLASGAVVEVVVVAAGLQWQPPMAWCGAGIRRPEVAEMGIKQKQEQCGYDRWKFLFSKIFTRVYFYMYPTVFPGYFLTAISPEGQACRI